MSENKAKKDIQITAEGYYFIETSIGVLTLKWDEQGLYYIECGDYRSEKTPNVSELLPPQIAKGILETVKFKNPQEAKATQEEIAKSILRLILSPPSIDQAVKASLLGKDAFRYLIRVLGKTVKRDKKTVGLELLHMLSAYTVEPANIGVEGPTSEGKTYPAVQAVTLFPKGDVWMLGGLSPTALAHDYGILVDGNRKPIEDQLEELKENIHNTRDSSEKTDLKKKVRELQREAAYFIKLEEKIIVFLEDPHPETWARLRPILSHDVEEVIYKFTDRLSRGAPLRQITAILRGWPVAVYFRATGKTSPFWDQMATRFTTISPEMTDQKYREGVRLIAMRKGLPHSVYAAKLGLDERERAKTAIRLIKERLIEIKEVAREKTGTYAPNIFWMPFYKRIGDDFPSKIGRHMRDSARFLTVLQMCAAINIFSRPTVEVDGVEHIIVTREDYERAAYLYLTETAETIFTGVPAHILDFFKKVMVPLKANFCLSDMVNKYLVVYGKTRSSDSIRKDYLPHLENIGLVDEEPDPADKRRMTYRVLREDILNEKSGNLQIFKNPAFFSLETLKEALKELEINRGLAPPLIRNFDNSTITVEDLYKMYYATPLNPRLILDEKKPPQTEKAPESAGFPKIGESPQTPESASEKPASGDLLPKMLSEWGRGRYTEFDDLLVRNGCSEEEAKHLRESWTDQGFFTYDPDGFLVNTKRGANDN